MTIAEAYMMEEADWGREINAKFTWLTNIKRGVQGNEKRSQLYTWPRRSLEYSIMFDGTASRNYVLRRLFFDIQKKWGVPWWPEVSLLTSQASSGQAILNLDTTYRSFAPGQSVVLLNNRNLYEVGLILNKDDTSITLSSNLTATWPSGTRVFPLLQGRLSQTSQIMKQQTSRFGGMSFQFKELYEADAMYAAGSHGFPSYNGYPVLNIEPEWSSGVECNISKAFEVMQQISGIHEMYTHQLESDFLMSYTYQFSTRAQCYAFESFFNTVAGRWAGLWVPTWLDDIVVTSGFEDTDVILSIENIEYSTKWANNDLVGRVIFFKFPDGTEAYRYVSGIPSATSITLNAAIGTTITTEQLPGLISCFLLPSRLDLDEIEMTYHTASVASTKMRTISLNNTEMSPIP